MELKNCAPVLFVRDAKKASEFYTDVLGQTIVSDFGGMNFVFKEGFALWQIDEANLIPQKLGADNIYNAKAVNRFELAFETDDIDKVHQELKAAGVTFLHEINTELWGQRNLRFYDPDGHLLEVGEAMHVFCQRIYEEEGRDLEAAARRMYMTPEMLKVFVK